MVWEGIQSYPCIMRGCFYVSNPWHLSYNRATLLLHQCLSSIIDSLFYVSLILKSRWAIWREIKIDGNRSYFMIFWANFFVNILQASLVYCTFVEGEYVPLWKWYVVYDAFVRVFFFKCLPGSLILVHLNRLIVAFLLFFLHE